MLRGLYYLVRYGPYLHSARGIQALAEVCLSRLIGKVARKSGLYREMNENLLVEQANLRMLADELSRKRVLDSGEFFSVRRRLWADTVLLAGVLVVGIGVAYTSLGAFLTEGGAAGAVGHVAAAVVLGFVLIGGGLVVVERFLEVLRPAHPAAAGQTAGGWGLALLWGLLFLGIAFALLGTAERQAHRLAEALGQPLLYPAYLCLMLLLPVLGGLLRWDALRFIDAYKRTQAQRQVETRLAQIDSILRQNEAFEHNFYLAQSLAAWRELNAFIAYKTARDARHGRSAFPAGHFAERYDLFQAEADRRYRADIRDAKAASMRKLEPFVKQVHLRSEPAAAGPPAGRDAQRADERAADRTRPLPPDRMPVAMRSGAAVS